MDFKMNGTVDFNKLGLTTNKDAEGDREVRGTLKISMVLSKEQTIKTFGARFSKLVFQQDKDGGWLYSSLKPSGTFDTHSVALDGLNRVPTIPTLEGVEPANGEEIRVKLRMPVRMEDDEMLLRICKHMGSPLDISIEPAQLDLPLEDAA